MKANTKNFLMVAIFLQLFLLRTACSADLSSIYGKWQVEYDYDGLKFHCEWDIQRGYGEWSGPRGTEFCYDTEYYFGADYMICDTSNELLFAISSQTQLPCIGCYEDYNPETDSTRCKVQLYYIDHKNLSGDFFGVGITGEKLNELLCPAIYILGENDARLNSLRTFRDEVLAKSVNGKKLIDSYYKNSEKIIQLFKKHPTLKIAAKKTLETIIPIIEKSLDNK